jgi:signal transduction histidine kinase
MVLVAATAGVMATVVSQTLARSGDREIDRRALHLAGMLSSSRLRLDDRLLGWTRELTRDEIAVIQRDTVLAATLPVDQRPALRKALQQALSSPASRAQAAVPIHISGLGYRAAVVPLSRGDLRGSTWLVALTPADQLQRTRRGIWGTALLAGGAGAVAGLLLARLATRWIARPIADLVHASELLAAGKLDARIPERGPGEIVRLSASFNSMAEALARSRQQLVEAERLAAVGRMAASIAHEVRNPLSGMRLHAQLAARGGTLDPATRSALQAVIDETDRLELVVGGVLDRAAPRPVLPVLADLAELLASMERLLAPRLAHQGIQLTLELPRELPRLPLDVPAMKQVVYNLVLNAAEESAAGGQIVLRAARDGASVRMCVLDRGRGFTAEALHRAFEPFFTTKREGFGLGLANARAVVAAHGGRLELANREGGGASVCAVLPLG